MPRPSRAVEEVERTCEEPGCTTRLSRYNLRARCWQHTEIAFPNYRGRRLAPEGPS
ncbi:MAG: hypothetical protein ACRDHB_05575 [Actinomycetota bacterium]